MRSTSKSVTAILAFWIVMADREAGHTFASGKHYKLRNFTDGGAHGKELEHEESL